jgi:hypothetical protein
VELDDSRADRAGGNATTGQPDADLLDARWTRYPFQRSWDRVQQRAARAHPEGIFLIVALAWGLLQVFIVPPLQVPDEGDHWFRAWALTDGQLAADPEGRLELPGTFANAVGFYTGAISDTRVLPASLVGLPGFTGYEDLFNGEGSGSPVTVVSRVGFYGPVGYLPQAAGIGLGRLVGASPLVCFYLARLANLLAAIALLFFAIRLAPFGKQLFVLIALLPMTMFELASVSCDALTISGAIFFTAFVLWAATRPTLRRGDVALLIAAAAVLLNIKPGYGALVLLVLLLRPAQLGGLARYLAFVVGTVLVVLGVSAITYLATGAAVRAGTAAGTSGQLAFVLGQPLGFAETLWSNLQNNLLTWTLQSIGVLGWFTVALPAALYLFVLLAGFAFFIGMAEKVSLRFWQRILMAAVGVATFVTIAVALYVFLPKSDGQISFQGRYLAPVWLLLLLSAYGLRFSRIRLGNVPMIGVLLVIMVVNLQTLMSSYG